jgi:hypothetical protein
MEGKGEIQGLRSKEVPKFKGQRIRGNPLKRKRSDQKEREETGQAVAS